MNSKDKSFFAVNHGMACISAELANLICEKVEKNQLLCIDTIQQELG